MFKSLMGLLWNPSRLSQGDGCDVKTESLGDDATASKNTRFDRNQTPMAGYRKHQVGLFTKNLHEEVSLKNLPTLRQAFIVASCLIGLGYLLEYYVHHIFGWLPLLVAGGLMFSGLVGICPMVIFLQKMPWNKKLKKSKDTKVNFE
jgi:hypothetical protein